MEDKGKENMEASKTQEALKLSLFFDLGSGNILPEKIMLTYHIEECLQYGDVGFKLPKASGFLCPGTSLAKIDCNVIRFLTDGQ